MNLELVHELVTALIKFCPICGKELEEVPFKTKTITPTPDGGRVTVEKTLYDKRCREGHGTFVVGVETNYHNDMPDVMVEFELDKDFINGKE